MEIEKINWEEVLNNLCYGNDANSFLKAAYKLNQEEGCPKHLIKEFLVSDFLCSEISFDKTIQDTYKRAEEIMEEFLKTPKIVGYKDCREICKCCNQKIGDYNPVPIYDISELNPWFIQEQQKLFEV